MGFSSPLNQSLLHEGTRPLRTVYEEDFGRQLAEVLYLPAAGTGGGGGWMFGDEWVREVDGTKQHQHQQQQQEQQPRSLSRDSWGTRNRAAAGEEVTFQFGRARGCCGVYISY